jgi:hypothetical protein
LKKLWDSTVSQSLKSSTESDSKGDEGSSSSRIFGVLRDERELLKWKRLIGYLTDVKFT